MTARDLIDGAVSAAGGATSVIGRIEPWHALDPLPELSGSRPAAFPFDALGPLLGGAARAIARDVQAPDALAAGSTLAAASLAAMAHADVVLPHGQRSPLSLFIVTSADSGDRKSATDQISLHEVEQVRQAQARQYLAEKAAAGDEKDSAKPTPRSLTIGKATTEGLQMILKGQSAVGLFTAEGGELLGGHSMREERRSAGLAWLLKAWSGETLDALTRGDGLSILLGRRVAMHALVQSVLMRQLLSDPLAQGQGLLARCLIAQPDTLAGTRLFRDADPNASAEVEAFHRRVRHLLHHKPVVRSGGDGCELDLLAMKLTPEAKAAWIEFYNEVEKAQAPGQPLEHARAFASKSAEHAARIAGVIQIVSDPTPGAVTEAAMAGGIEVARFYLGEHVRLTGAGVEERNHAHLHMLVNWLRERVSPVPHRDVLQRAPNPVRLLKAEGIGKLIDELKHRRYIRRAGDGWEVRRHA